MSKVGTLGRSKAAKFWAAVQGRAAELLAIAQSLDSEQTRERATQQLYDIAPQLGKAAQPFNRFLGVEFNPVSPPEGSRLEIIITCDGNGAGMQAVQDLVALAPALPKGLSVRAFRPPLPQEVIEASEVEIGGKKVRLADLRYVATPSATQAGRFDLQAYVPWQAVTPQDINAPGSVVAMLALGHGIGEERLLTRVGELRIELTFQPATQGLRSWELCPVLDQRQPA
ncbi:hypothetical protein [Azohydromonas caseinilytica]|uniref:Uncharacterized protein n=1 Tax=Azohydromonas caseinilytica TaxID=2728836 RepID=A0A848FBS6_9BURK|nr:hypothetical protein [Azohydromonas caseinilytica]NML16366.1 hypothetical protein [Azohydromonas caseinilytica]